MRQLAYARLGAVAGEPVHVHSWNASLRKMASAVVNNRLSAEAKKALEELHALRHVRTREGRTRVAELIVKLKNASDENTLVPALVGSREHCSAGAIASFRRRQLMFKFHPGHEAAGYETFSWNNFIYFRYGLDIQEVVFNKKLPRGRIGRDGGLQRRRRNIARS